jgi:hypothetical protein
MVGIVDTIRTIADRGRPCQEGQRDYMGWKRLMADIGQEMHFLYGFVAMRIYTDFFYHLVLVALRVEIIFNVAI